MNEEALDTPELERGRFSVLIANVGEAEGAGSPLKSVEEIDTEDLAVPIGTL